MATSSATRRPCEVCRKTVDSEHEAYKKHVSACKAKMTQEKRERAAKAKVAPADMNVKDKALAKRIERARKAADRERKLAPDVIAGKSGGIDPLRKIELYAREKGLITDSEYVFFGKEGRGDQLAGEGYIPLVDEGEQLRHNELEAYYRPKEIRDAKRTVSERESLRRIHRELRVGEANLAKKLDK